VGTVPIQYGKAAEKADSEPILLDLAARCCNATQFCLLRGRIAALLGSQVLKAISLSGAIA
jgi:hypothetical protein